MKMPDKIEGKMLAACGVNCMACLAHLRQKNHCGGCHAPDSEKRGKSCINCAKLSCARQRGHSWCFECERFPCNRLKSLAKTYREKYGVDIIQNGVDARQQGIGALMAAQRTVFSCAACGGVVCQHSGLCSECGAAAV